MNKEDPSLAPQNPEENIKYLLHLASLYDKSEDEIMKEYY